VHAGQWDADTDADAEPVSEQFFGPRRTGFRSQIKLAVPGTEPESLQNKILKMFVSIKIGAWTTPTPNDSRFD
jgi:hypothetical protein